MTEYTGRVETIVEEAGTGKNPPHRPFVKFSVRLNGKYYGCFLDDKNEAMLRAVAEHDEVVITTKINGKFENLDTIKVLFPKAAEIKSTGINAKSLAPGPVGWLDDKDFRITYLACRRDAVEFVQALVTIGALRLGTSVAKQADSFYEAVRRYALAFAYDAWNVRKEDAKQLVVPADDKGAAKALEE